MATTFLELTNRVLRRINEVELTDSLFASPRGVHATVKDAVQDTVRKVNHSRYKWPWNSANATQVLTIGQQEYSWPNDFQAVEWSSFYIEKDDTLNTNTDLIQVIPREKFFLDFRDLDQDSVTEGRDKPYYVYQTPTGWGVTPNPNQEFTIKYRYWTTPTDLISHDDECGIPSEWDYVITVGALYHMYMFMDNSERTQLIAQAFKDGMNDMINRYSGENHHYAHSPRSFQKVPNR